MGNVAKQKRYPTTDRSKGWGEATVTLDRAYLTAYCKHGSISFTLVNYTGR